MTRRQLSAANLIRENTALQKEVFKLKDQIADLKAENERLERIIEGLRDSKFHTKED